MSDVALRTAYATVERSSAAAVDAALAANGVPTTPAEAAYMAETMVPWMNHHRQKQWAVQAAAIRARTPGMTVAPPRMYTVDNLTKLIMRTAGLMPGQPMTVPVEMFDAATQKDVTHRIAPFSMPEDEAVKIAMARRLAAGLARHAKQAGRDAVIDTATVNRVRWARQMSGSETCPFCAMLVSRGAVYSEQTAHFRTHDHCDCTAVVVPNPKRWDGKDQADEFEQLWRESVKEAKKDPDATALAVFRRKYRKMNGE